MTARVLVACVGNVLRGDDGFGVAVARRLADDGWQPPGVDLIETGIGGLNIVQQLMEGYQALIVVDAVERGAEPGTVFVLEPEVSDPRGLTTSTWQAVFSNLHLAEPHRVFLLARALGVLPPRLALVGCQPRACDDVAMELSPSVQSAVPIAASKVVELAEALVAERDLPWRSPPGPGTGTGVARQPPEGTRVAAAPAVQSVV